MRTIFVLITTMDYQRNYIHHQFKKTIADYLKSFLFILLSGISVGNTTSKVASQRTYLLNARQFISYYMSTKVRDSINLSDLAGGHFFRSCEKSLLGDTAFLSEAEKKEIASELDHPLIQRWTTELVGAKIRLINDDTARAIFKDPHLVKDWRVFNAKYGKDLWRFSAPIFVRNNTICIFYSEQVCGNNCGSGEISLYEKDGDSWKLITTFCDWMS
jgi:hypothetical protein